MHSSPPAPAPASAGSPFRAAHSRSPSPARALRGASSTGALWSLPVQSSVSFASPSSIKQQPSQHRSPVPVTPDAQAAVDEAADALMRHAQLATEHKEETATSITASTTDAVPSTPVQQQLQSELDEFASNDEAASRARARRTAAARLERKLLRDLELRHPPPLLSAPTAAALAGVTAAQTGGASTAATAIGSIPTHVNVSVRPAAQAYGGKVGRLRNTIEVHPSAFKTMHAHVQANMRALQAAQAQGQPLEEEHTAPVHSYAAEQARAKAAKHSREHSRTMLRPLSAASLGAAAAGVTSPDAVASPVSMSVPTSMAAAASVSSPAASTAATVGVSPLVPSLREYNRYASQRPSVAKEMRTAMLSSSASSAALPSVHAMFYPESTAAAAAAAANADSDGGGRSLSSSPVGARSLAPSASQPVLLPSRTRAAASAAQRLSASTTGAPIDFAYSADEEALHKALVAPALPMPLAQVKPTMFEYTYAPPVVLPARTKVHTPRGTNLTVQARGYSSSERVSLLVEGFRHEQAQQAQNLAWLQRFRDQYEAEQRALKSAEARRIWEQTLREQAEEDARAARAPMDAAQFEDEQDRLRAAKKLKPQRVHLTVPSGTMARAASLAAIGGVSAAAAGGTPTSPDLSRAGGGKKSGHKSRPSTITTTTKHGGAHTSGMDGEAKAAAAGSGGGDDSPSSEPSTPPGFYFASKMSLNSFAHKKMEKQLGLAPSAHAYDSDDAEWAHGDSSDDDGDGGDDDDADSQAEGAEGSRASSARRRQKAAALSDAKDHDERMELMLREVFENAKAASAKAGQEALSSVLPRRRPGKVLNAARFVMANPQRKKARLAPGETGFARGSGFISAVQERERAEQARKEKENNHAARAVAAQQAALADAERRKRNRARSRAAPPAAVALSNASAASAGMLQRQAAEAPMVYTGCEPAWLRNRADYRQEFLPRSQAHLALNSMEKPLAIRSAHESENILEYLRTLPYLRDFAAQPQLQQELLALCRLQPAKKGELIYKAGELGTQIFILVQGSVRSITRPPAVASSPSASPASSPSMRGSVGRGVKERKHSMKPVSLSHTLAVPGFEEASLHPAAVAGAAAATASFGSTLEEAGTTSVRPALAQLDTSTNPFGDGGGGIEGDEVRMLSPTSAAAAGEEGGSSPTADEASGADGAGGFLSMRAMQMTPGKRAWSAARDRASKALADATDDYGLSDPAATIHLLLPGAVFGLSREAAVQREQEAAAARVEVPRARRRWRRLAESVRVQKGLLSSYHAAELEVEGKQPNNTNGPAATPTARAHAAQARSRRPNLTTAVGRLRAETMLSASDDTLLITLAQSEHDRVMQSNLDRHRFKQVQALQCMAIFQQPAVQQQQQAAQGVKPVPTKASKRAAVLSPWKIKHLVQLLPWLTPVSFPPHAVIAEEDQLCHTLWLVVSGAVTLWKDVELRVHTRLPAAPGEAQTVMESRKYRRVHVATRGRGDALAEEAVLGAPKLDFTLKAGGGGVELFAIQRRHFLPFFRPARLAILRTRVAAARSSAVNYLNATASDLLPGTSLGLVRSADEEGGGDDEAAAMFAPKQHHIVVNMLEAIADDLRGEEDAGRNRSGSGGVKRRVQKSSSGSLSSTASAAAAIAAVAAESNALPPSVVPGSRVPLASFKADPQASRVWVSPQATPAGAGGVGAGATAVPGSTPLSPVTIAKGPGLHVSASTGSLVLLGQTEHRPHSPAKYQTAVRLPAHIVTPLPAKPALSLQASSAAARRIIFDLPEEGHEASGSASPSPSDESGSTSSSKLGGNLLWNSALFARDGATAASSSSSSARVTATSSTAALLPDMLLNNRVQLNENDVARIRQQQQHAAAALALQQQHQAQAQREAAAARAARLASPVRRVRIVNPGSPPPSTPGSPQMVAMSAGTPVEPLSPASLPPVAAVPPTPVTASAAVITNVLLSRTETTADQPTHNGSAASQLHVFFAMFTV